MNFSFSEDQRLFQDTARDFFAAELGIDRLRELWEAPAGRSPELWQQIADLGFLGMLVPQSQGGLGLEPVDFVLIAEECGYACLSEPLIDNALLAAMLLRSADFAQRDEWLEQLATGALRFAVGHWIDPCVADADGADILLLQRKGALAAYEAAAVSLSPAPSMDQGRRLSVVDTSACQPVATQPQADDQALDLGALACAAQLLGCTQRMLDITLEYTAQRHQFGVPVASFQAIKHRMADVAVALEFARPTVYRAAFALSGEHAARSGQFVAHAKLAAADAATLAARNCIQAHGAMGYTWEADLHLWMKRAWSLDKTWGGSACHKSRLLSALLNVGAQIGPGAQF